MGSGFKHCIDFAEKGTFHIAYTFHITKTQFLFKTVPTGSNELL